MHLCNKEEGSHLWPQYDFVNRRKTLYRLNGFHFYLKQRPQLSAPWAKSGLQITEKSLPKTDLLIESQHAQKQSDSPPSSLLLLIVSYTYSFRPSHLNIRATLMQMSMSLRWFSTIQQRVTKALLDKKEGRDSDWSAIFLKAAVT